MHDKSCLFIDNSCFKKALNILYMGGVIVYPTDTIYGIGGDPFDVNVVNRITHLKSRRGNPYPILVGSIDNALRLLETGETTVRFMKRFWPGGLTIVGRARYGVPANFFMDKIGVRMPRHPSLLRLIEASGGYLIGTSANLSGMPPATSVEKAYSYFGDRVDLYLDGGESPRLSSTVIEVEKDKVIVRRVGAIDIDVLTNFCREIGCRVYEEV